MLELKVDNQIISYTKINNEDYISITDMLKSKDGEFAIIKSNAGLNSYKISVKEWSSKLIL